MSRLYLRIFLSFWLVIILTIGAVLAINGQLERAQRDDTAERERATRLETGLVRAANHALNEGGRQGLIEWAEQPRRRMRGTRDTHTRRARLRRIRLYVFDSAGEELLERTPNRKARRIARRWQPDGELPDEMPRGQFAQSLAHPEHGRYLVVLSRPPRSILLRIFGPLGLWGLIALAVVFSGGICFWLARTITRPLRQLRRAGQALGQGEFDTRVPDKTSRRGDELGDLARGFNHMAERLEKLVAAQRQLLRDVSHELRSPLARLQAALTLAADSQDEATRERHLKRTDAEVGRLNRLIGEILGYARLTEGIRPRRARFDLVDLIEDIAASARLEGTPRDLQVRVDAPETVLLSADEELLHRAIENVVRNALRHAPQAGTIDLAVEVGRQTVAIVVSDRGPGIPEDKLEAVFEPFVRLDNERGEFDGSGGIGLAIARAAVLHHDGSIHAKNRPQGGLAVRIELPL